MFRIANPPDLGSLKLTVQQFYRPNGDSTQQRGVLADVMLPVDHRPHGRERRPTWIIRSPSTRCRPTPFNQLRRGRRRTSSARSRSMSTQRMEKSDEFEKLQKNIERYEEQKAKKEVPLNEQKFLARRAELDADEEEEKTFEDQANGDGDDEVFKRNYYNNEVLTITLDYLRLLGKDKVAQAN